MEETKTFYRAMRQCGADFGMIQHFCVNEGNGLGIVRARHDSFKPCNGPNDERKKNRLQWGVEETKTFYRAMRQCKADFGMMQYFCEGRTRAQLKRKFMVESRRNPRLMVDMR